MRKVVLKDGTTIETCTDQTTVDQVFVLRSTYAEAGGVMDTVNSDNASIIKVYDENDELVSSGADLVLIPDTKIYATDEGVIFSFSVRRKTEMEVLTDRVSDLEDVVIEG